MKPIDDVFLIAGSVEPNETLMASVIRHCRRMVDVRLKPCHRLYLAKVINGMVDHEPVKISISVVDIFYKDLHWRARHHTLRMATLTVDNLNDIVESYDEQPGPLPPLRFRPSWLFRLRMELHMSFLFTLGMRREFRIVRP